MESGVDALVMVKLGVVKVEKLPTLFDSIIGPALTVTASNCLISACCAQTLPATQTHAAMLTDLSSMFFKTDPFIDFGIQCRAQVSQHAGFSAMRHIVAIAARNSTHMWDTPIAFRC